MSRSLWNIRPRAALYDLNHSACTNPKRGCHFCIAADLGMEIAYSANFILGQFSSVGCFARAHTFRMRMDAVLSPKVHQFTLRGFHHILLVGSKFQVCWIDAGWVIALVHAIKSFRNRAIGKLITKPVREHEFIVSTELPITEGHPICGPKPTSGGAASLINLSPEAANKGGLFNKWYITHVVDLLTRLTANPRAFIAPLGFSMPQLYHKLGIERAVLIYKEGEGVSRARAGAVIQSLCGAGAGHMGCACS